MLAVPGFVGGLLFGGVELELLEQQVNAQENTTAIKNFTFLVIWPCHREVISRAKNLIRPKHGDGGHYPVDRHVCKYGPDSGFLMSPAGKMSCSYTREVVVNDAFRKSASRGAKNLFSKIRINCDVGY